MEKSKQHKTRERQTIRIISPLDKPPDIAAAKKQASIRGVFFASGIS
ncbi:MAG: hypothetical protein RIN56_04335 [Sporomusaceae bacterium]|nr:hypothetical protein [Sporomusaceae bacterium]